MIQTLRHFVHSMINQPLKVFVVGLVITLVMLTMDGSLWRLWSLQRGHEDIQLRMVDLENKAKKLEFKIHQAQKLTYIERQATDQFDYVREGDLIFVFAE